MNMKLRGDISGIQREVLVNGDGPNIEASVDGRRYELQVVDESGSESYLLLLNNRVYDCEVTPVGGPAAVFDVRVGTAGHRVAITDPRGLRGSQGTGSRLHSSAEIAAPMAGKIVRVLVEAGETVEAGQGLVVVEAMKMQNELKAPASGTVTEIRATAGATVNAGDILVRIESSAEKTL